MRRDRGRGLGGGRGQGGPGGRCPVPAVPLARGMEPPTGTESARLVSPRGGPADGSLRLKRYHRHRHPLAPAPPSPLAPRHRHPRHPTAPC